MELFNFWPFWKLYTFWGGVAVSSLAVTLTTQRGNP